MKRVFIVFIIHIFCFIFLSEALAFEVYLREEKLSVKALRVPLQDLLRKLSEQGLEIKIDPEINPLVSADFKDREVQEAVRSIIKPLNHVLIWKAVDGPVGRITRLAEIQIFEPGRQGLMKNLVEKADLAVEKDAEQGFLYVKDEILLTLNKGMTLEAFKELLRRIKGTVIDSYPFLGIYRIRLPENSDVPALVDQLGRNEGVAETEPNYVYPISGPSRSKQSLQPVPDLADSPLDPGVVPVAVLDTGWNAAYDQAVSVKASLDVFHPEQSISDPLGHGTQMSLLAAGMVKPYGVKMDQDFHNPVIPIRVFDENGYTSNFQVMKSIDFALENGAGIISLSWGAETKSAFLEDQLSRVSDQGVIVLAAAGNEPTGQPVYPASYDAVLGIGALGPDGKTWSESNYGEAVFLYAPGYASFPVGYKGEPGTYAGTSISTAFMASLFADYLSRHPGASREEVLRVLNRK